MRAHSLVDLPEGEIRSQARLAAAWRRRSAEHIKASVTVPVVFAYCRTCEPQAAPPLKTSRPIGASSAATTVPGVSGPGGASKR